MKNILILFSLIIIWSCDGGESKNQDSLLEINLEKETISKVSDVFANIEYQPLQLPSHLYLGVIDKTIIKNDRIYTFDYQQSQSLFAFKLNGEFLFTINSVGQGPGEFLRPVDYLISDQGIEILDATNKVLFFDLNGNFQKEIKLSVNANKFIKLDNNEYILYTKKSGNTAFGQNVDCDLTLYNLSNQEKECLLSRKGVEVPFIQERNNVFVSSKEVLFSKMFYDSIFMVKGKTLEPAYALNFGRSAFPKQLIDPNKFEMTSIVTALNSNSGKGYHTPELFATDQIMITKYSKGKLYYLFVDKISGRAKSLKVNTVNDLDGGVPFLTIGAVYKNQAYTILDPNYFMDRVDAKRRNPNSKIDKSFLALAEKLTPNDPPVIVKYTFKK